MINYSLYAKNTVLFLVALTCITIACAAAWYSISQSKDYIAQDLGGNQTWNILAYLAVLIELVLIYMIVQMLRVGQVVSLIMVPLLLITGVAAIGVSIYLEGGKASMMLSKAEASRNVDSLVAQGHKNSLQKLFTTQSRLIDSRRLNNRKVNDLNAKIAAQEKWAKSTATVETNPIIKLVSSFSGLENDKVNLIFIGLIVGLPMLVKMLFMHCGLMMLTTPFRQSSKVRETAPEKSQDNQSPVQTTDQKPTGLQLVKSGDTKKRLGMSLQKVNEVQSEIPDYEQSDEQSSQSDKDNVLDFPGLERLTAKQKRKQRLEKKKKFVETYDYDTSSDGLSAFVTNNFDHAQNKPKGKSCKDYYMTEDDIFKSYHDCFPGANLSRNRFRKTMAKLPINGKLIGKVRSNNVNWYRIRLRNKDLRMMTG